MADQPNSHLGGSQSNLHHSSTGSRSPIRTRSLSRLLSQQVTHPSEISPKTAEKRPRSQSSEHISAKKSRHKSSSRKESNQDSDSSGDHSATFLVADHPSPSTPSSGSEKSKNSKGKKRQLKQTTSSEELSSTSLLGSIEQKASSSKKQESVKEPRATRSKTTGSCASNRRRSSRVTKLNLSSNSGGGTSRSHSATAMSGVDTGQEGSSTSFPEDNTASGGGTSSTGILSSAAKGEVESDDNEMGRLQALLEARGLPPHLFGALGPRMQHLLHRSLGGGGRAHQLLAGLQATGDEGAQLQAAMEMCQLLVMGNEDTLAGFPVKQAVPVLTSLLAMDHNFDMMNHACRALTYMMEALPRSSTVVVDAIPVFLEKLQVIQCMDVAEQSLTALEMLSRRHSKAILHARGVSSCLTFLDFFSINAQRAALSITANCCQNLTLEEFPLVSDSLPLLSNRILTQDKKCMESVCLAFSRLVEGYANEPGILREVAAHGLLTNVQQLLLTAPPPTFVPVVRMLALLCAACPDLAVSLLRLNISDTLRFLLLGPSASTKPDEADIELVPRSPQELFEITSLIGELMPRLPSDGIFSVDALLHKSSHNNVEGVLWQWKDDRGVWHPYAGIDNKIIEAAHQSGEDEISLSTMGRTYTLDFNAMQQINEDSGTTRPVQRKVNNFGQNSCSAPLSPVANGGSDSRADCLQSNMELAAACIQSLFAVLYEVYSSSAGPAVRHKCLRALLRMVYIAPAELLRQILKSQPVSSHVAAMLASSDLRVVVAALQMAEILMQKLPEVFGVYFRREGVMHQIRWLSRMEVTPSPSPPTGMDVNSGFSSLPTLLDKSPYILHNSMWTSTAATPSPEEDHYFPLGHVRISDVLKRKRTPKRGNSTNRKVRTEEVSHRDGFGGFGSGLESSRSFTRNLMENPILGTSVLSLAATTGAGASPVLLPSTSSSSTRSSSSSTKLGAKTNSLLANLNPTRWGRWNTSQPPPPPPETPSPSQKTSPGNKDKIRSWIKERAAKLEESYFSADHIGHPAMNVLNKLMAALAHLDSSSTGALKALEEIRSVVIDSDISSFELNHSGLITKLLTFLTSEEGSTPRFDRLRAFLHVFLGSPLTSLETCEVERLDATPFSLLVAKLNACLSQLEQFSVKVHDLPGSARGGALRFFNTHQLKCNLQRHPSCTNLRQWRGGPVKIDPLALVQAIERYLVLRGYGRIKDDDDDGSDEDGSDDDIDDTMAAMIINQGQGKHKLQFLIGDHVLPYNMTVYQAIRQYGASEGSNVDGQETDTESENPLGYTNVWVQTHSIWYRPVPSDESDSSNTTPTSATKRWSASSSASTSRRGAKASGGRTSPKKKTSDELWNEGIVPDSAFPLNNYLQGSLPETVTHRDQSLEVIALLRVLYGLSAYWGSLYEMTAWSHAVPPAEFVSPKLTAKANRQLQDPLAIMTGNVPSWLAQIAYACPFLFPFETRHLLFYVTAFDRDRALQRLLDMAPDLTSSDSTERVTPRLDRRKRTVSREDLLKQAELVMTDLASSKALLEIQYESEVGTGLGPTLEFYALVSHELQRADLDMWRGETTLPVPPNSRSYIHAPSGLFPLPLGRTAKANHVAKVRNRFKLLGRFMAKALMDSRVLDISLSPAFYRWLLNQENSLCSRDLPSVDATFARTFSQLEVIAHLKRRLEHDTSQSPSSLKSALESLTLDGQPIESLCLDFTLPGNNNIELQRGGRDIPVSVHNVDRYVNLVAHWTLVEGVRRQMEAFREGFEAVFPLSQLQLFYPEELENLFCGSAHTSWDLKTLTECCRPDHGYQPESRAIHFLFEILSTQTPEEQRKFLQFVTGSPRLPVGGLKSLSPPLTIVRKTLDPSENPDDYLPSVMTCVNYLKLPDYSSVEKMREKLNIAMYEGQLSFHLS